MRFLPVAHRELLAAAHRRSTYRVRWAVALGGALGAGLGFIFMSGVASPAQLGIALFQILGSGCVLLAGLAGLFLTADAIATERRDGTLGLLYLTELQPFDILAGKLVALGANSVCALLAVFPVLSVAWILGGFTGAEILRLLLGGLNVLFVSLAVGLAVSAWATRQSAAVGGTAAVLGVLAMWPLLTKVLGLPGTPWVVSISPLVSIGAARGWGYSSNQYWSSLAIGFATGWSFLALAAVGLRRGWRSDETETRFRTENKRPRRVLSESNLERLPQRALQNLFSASPRLKRLAWIAACLPLVFAAIAAVSATKDVVTSTYLVAAFSMGLLLKGIFAWEAVAALSEARQLGALELLLTTPVTDHDIHQAQRAHLLDIFLPPMLLLYGSDWLVIFWNSASPGPGGGTPLVIMSLMGCLLTVLQGQAMILGGLWWSIREVRSTIAFAKTFLLGTVLSIPLLWFCCIGYLVPIILISWLTSKLRTPLRALLTEKQPTPNFV